MNEEEVFEKNLTLSTEFSRYLLEHPEFAEQLPSKAHVILLPKYDPELYATNLRGSEIYVQRGSKQPIVFVEVEKLAPLHSRLVGPRLVQSDSLSLREPRTTYLDHQDETEPSDDANFSD